MGHFTLQLAATTLNTLPRRSLPSQNLFLWFPRQVFRVLLPAVAPSASPQPPLPSLGDAALASCLGSLSPLAEALTAWASVATSGQKLLAHPLHHPPISQGNAPRKCPQKPCLVTFLTSPPPEVPASTAPSCFHHPDSNLTWFLAHPSPSEAPAQSLFFIYLYMLSGLSLHPPLLILQP